MVKSRIRPFVVWLGIYFLCLIVGAMNIGDFGSLLKLIAFIPGGIWLFQNHSISKNTLLQIASIFIGFCVVSYFWSIDKSGSQTRIVSQLTFLFLLMAVSGYRYNDFEIDFLRNCLVWSSRVTAVLVLLTGGFFEGRIVLNGLIREDPNYLCAYFMYGIAAALIVLIGKGTVKEKAVSSIELMLYLYIAIGTGSRGGLLAIITCALAVFFFYKQGTGSGGSTVVKKLSAIGAIVIIVFLASSYVSTDILNRFSLGAVLQSNGTGRYILWEDAMNAFLDSSVIRQVLGYGAGSAIAITHRFPFRIHNVFHNMFIETLLELGCIGLVTYSLHIFSFAKRSLQSKDVYSFSIIIGMIVLSLSTSICVFKPYWNIMLFVVAYSQTYGNCDYQSIVEPETPKSY